MAAQKARQLALAAANTLATDGARGIYVTATDGSQHLLSFAELSRVESAKALQLRFPSINGQALFRATEAQKLAAWQAGEVPASWQTAPTAKLTPHKRPEARAPLSPAGGSISDADVIAAASQAAAQAAHSALTSTLPTAIAQHLASADVIESVAQALSDAGKLSVSMVTIDETDVTLPDTHHAALPDVILALAAQCHVYVAGPAGSGKSTLAAHAADALGLPHTSMSVGPMDTPTKLFGFIDAGGSYHGTTFRDAFENGKLFILDEVDNGNAAINTTLNQALANGSCAFPDGVIPMHSSFRVVATANTLGRGGDRQYIGRSAQDAAFMDRFVVLDVDYDETLETALTLAYARDDSERDTLTRWVARVRSLRGANESLKLGLVISPRASIFGARLITVGASFDKAESMTIGAKIPADTLAKLRDAAGKR